MWKFTVAVFSLPDLSHHRCQSKMLLLLHGGFDVTVSLFSWGHPLTRAHALVFIPLKYLVSGVLHENKETVTSK